jgi:peroxiredoxin
MKKLLLNLFVLLIVSANAFSQGYKVGDYATDFKLKNVDGRMVSMTDFPDAKGFIIVFTCNHCPFSIAYEDRINALNKKYNSLGYVVIAINPNDPAVNAADSYDNMIIRAKDKSFTFPYLFDEGQKVFPVYGAIKTPHVFILKRTDKGMQVKYIGAIDDNYEDATAVKNKYVEDAVNALLNNKNPKIDFTKAIGCGIKVKS